MKHPFSSILGIFFLPALIGAGSFQNYSSAITVSRFALSTTKLYAAYSGGFYVLDKSSGQGQSIIRTDYFPDPKLTAVAIDGSGGVWAGSAKGYLSYYYGSGADVYNFYYAANWGIRDLLVYKKYLFVAASGGFSVFDCERKTAIKNATRFGQFSSPNVNCIAVYGDTLYLGCDQGTAKLDIAGDRLADPSVNLFDQAIWQCTSSIVPIVSFVKTGDTVAGSVKIAAVFKGKVAYADSTLEIVTQHTSDTTVSYDTTPHYWMYYNHDSIEVSSAVTSIVNDNENRCWMGTREDYFWQWDGGKQATVIVINGPTVSIINKVHATANGNVWFLPKISSKGKGNWWEGVGRLDETAGSWKLYNEFCPAQHIYGNCTGNFGWLGGNLDFHGICEDRAGNMWFGASGGNIKEHRPASDDWIRYYEGQMDTTTFYRYAYDEPEHSWGKCDAVAQDSNGFMWFANWFNPAGCLICYDPQNIPDPTKQDPLAAHYRRFFPGISPEYVQNIYSITVDRNNRIFVGSGGGYDDDGRLIIFSYSGNPLQNGIDTLVVSKTKEYETIRDMHSTPDGSTWMATGKGLYKCDAGLLRPAIIDSTMINITGIRSESNTVLWLSTWGNGLVRFDYGNNKKITLDTNSGLVSNYINGLDIDRKNGLLWLATQEGLVRYTLGRGFIKIPDNSAVVAYPNPYSLRRDAGREILFSKCSPNSSVYVYGLGGQKLQTLTVQEKDRNDFDWVVRWKPASNCAPGIYYFVARPENNGALTTPGSAGYGKILIIP